MAFMMLGTKVGMTRTYATDGLNVPVTALRLGPCVVTQIRTVEKDGYSAVQVGYGEIKPRNSTQPEIGHDAKAGTTPKRWHREFRCTPKEAAAHTVGQELTVADMEGQLFVDVTATSKGKGFQGVMKRWHFKGMFATHGTERKHRSPGSIGSLCSNRGFGGGLKKGKKMAGRMGNVRCTMRSIQVIRLDAANGLMLIKGAVPGPNTGMVQVRHATRLYKSKATLVAKAKAGK
ncbi:50S ribosomal protein L3 [soil metagenome]